MTPSRADYARQPGLLEEVMALLGVVFPGVPDHCRLVRGPFAPEGEPLMLAAPSHC